jgi:Tol biopolymer transport system component
MKPDGSGVRQLTFIASAADGAALQASWSADGTQIVYRERPSGDPAATIVRGLYLMGSDGSNQRRLFTDPNSGVFSPSFSPDGTRVAFSLCPDGQPTCAIYTIKTDGTGLTAVTRFNARGEVFDFAPQYSPSGASIAFAGFNRPGPESVAIYVVSVKGGAVRQLTDTSIGASDPDWSPDGSHLSFTSEEAVWTMKADGSGAVRLSNPGRSHDGLARYSPRGDKLVFERDSPNFSQSSLVAINTDGTNEAIIANGLYTTNSFQPDWGTAP